jgi:hypothetical protein
VVVVAPVFLERPSRARWSLGGVAAARGARGLLGSGVRGDCVDRVAGDRARGAAALGGVLLFAGLGRCCCCCCCSCHCVVVLVVRRRCGRLLGARRVASGYVVNKSCW